MNGTASLHSSSNQAFPLAVFTPFLVDSSDVNDSDENEVWITGLTPSVHDDYIVQELYQQFALYYPEDLSCIQRLLAVTWELKSGTTLNQEVI